MRAGYTIEHFQRIEADAIARTPERQLMRRAARAVAERVLELLPAERYGRRVTLLVGTGNNGGDALFAGAWLQRRGIGVRAVLLDPERVHEDGLDALLWAGGRLGDAEDVARADVVVDGIVGLSARGGLRPAAARLVERITAPVVSVDLPSGVEPNTGVVDGAAVRATITVTFQALKPVHVLGEGSVYSGRVDVVDIGIPLPTPDFELLEDADVGSRWPIPRADSDKYSQGVTGVVAGSSTYPGAAVLATTGAVRATSGMVRFAGSAADQVRAWWPEVVATGAIADAGRVQAWTVGPGLGTGAAAKDTIVEILGKGQPVIADADALTVLGEHRDVLDARQHDTPLVLTPHDNEFRRLAGDVGGDRIAAAQRAARDHSATVLLKGFTTVVADETGRVLINPARGAWPATAGSGDVLSGMVGALLASGMDPLYAAGCAAYVHSLAAEIAADGAPISASVLATGIPDAIRQVRRSVS